MKTLLNLEFAKAILILAVTALLISLFAGCITTHVNNDPTTPEAQQTHCKAYNYGYWTATFSYNTLAFIAPSKADWALKVDAISKDAQPYLQKAKNGELTIESALNLIAGSFPKASHWTDLIQAWTKAIADKGSDTFYGIADATTQYLAGNPVK